MAQPFTLPILVCLRRLVLGDLSQRQLSQCRQVSFAKEVVERLFDLLYAVDFSLAQPCAQCFDRNVDVHHFVRPTEKVVWHGLAHTHASGARDHVVQ